MHVLLCMALCSKLKIVATEPSCLATGAIEDRGWMEAGRIERRLGITPKKKK